MKNKGKMRILALVLCMVVMLSNSSFIFASGETETAAAAPETTAVTPEPEVSATSELAELPTPEPTAEPTEAPTPEPTAEPTPEASAAPEPTEVPTPEVSAAPEPTAEPTPEASAVPEPTEVPTPEASAAPEPTEIPTSEPTPEASASPTPAAEQDIGSEESAAVTPTPEAEPEPDGSSEEIVLEGSCGDTTVILSGPASSFPEGTELSILVQEPAEEDQEVIEEAVEKQAEEQEMEVKSYTALDIRLLSNGEEIQPLGPVSVKFQQPEQQERTAEETSTQVLHVDESTGDATDMEAEVTEDGEVAIETTHFSIYVVVDLEQLGGEIELTVQHWATVEQLDGVNGQDGLIESAPADGTPWNATARLNSKEVFSRIYTDDTIKMDNQLNKNVEELSKVLLADVNSNIKNYKLEEIWVLKDGQAAGTESPLETSEIESEKNKWTVYTLDNTNKTITLTKNSTIRMIYKPQEADNALSQPVTFYDYNITWDGTGTTGNGIRYVWTDGGINYSQHSNGVTTGTGGGWTGGNYSNQLAIGLQNNGFYHYRNDATLGGLYINRGNGDGFTVVKNMVTRVNEDGPIYNGLYDKNYFNDNPTDGKTVLKDYTLNFKQEGDTYTLQSVKKGDIETLSGLDVLSEIYDKWTNWGGNRHIFSNNFWPLDKEDYDGIDPKFGDQSFAGASDQLRNTTANNASDDGQAHNWFFGMRYDFEFTLGDYEGPLNFYFRGDDDFWLFVDGELKTDLGGIHSAVGELLDLSYLKEQDKNETHKITIIYAERGGHGSTCYMQFTIPNVKPVNFDTEVEKTSVTVEKEWIDHNNPDRPTAVQVKLYYREAGERNWTEYDTQTLNQTNGWKYTWQNLPKEGYQYRVEEVSSEDLKHYITSYSPNTDGTLQQQTDGTYDGTYYGKITNRASPSTTIKVTKVWDDGENASRTRPDSVEFFLFYRTQGTTEWKQYPGGRLTVNASGNWEGEYMDLPVYAGDSETKLEYTVMEISGDNPLMEGEKLPGKSTGQENFQYTVSYDKENHCGTGNQWTGYVAKEGITLDLIVTNSLGREIEVTKQWKGTLESNIPPSIYVGLYLNDEPVDGKYIQLKKAESWKGSFKYLGEGTYTVKELRETTDSKNAEFTIDNKNYIGVDGGGSVTIDDVTYDVTYSQGTTTNNKTTYTITNQGSWRMIKKSKSGNLFLGGAVFTLTQGGSNPVYTGTSVETTGLVTWKDAADSDVDIATITDGIYTLTEKTAPTGYQPGGTWEIIITNGVPTSIVKTNSDGSIDKSDKGEYENGILTFYYENEALYALPDSGETGIYGYVLGGMLFMTAAVLMLYKQRLGGGAGRKRR